MRSCGSWGEISEHPPREGGPCHWRPIYVSMKGNVLGEDGGFLSKHHRRLRHFTENPHLALWSSKTGMFSQQLPGKLSFSPWLPGSPNGLSKSQYCLPRVLGPATQDLKQGHTNQVRGQGGGPEGDKGWPRKGREKGQVFLSTSKELVQAKTF